MIIAMFRLVEMDRFVTQADVCNIVMTHAISELYKTNLHFQELEPNVAMQLCSLWENSNSMNQSLNQQFQNYTRSKGPTYNSFGSQFYQQNQGGGGRALRSSFQHGYSGSGRSSGGQSGFGHSFQNFGK